MPVIMGGNDNGIDIWASQQFTEISVGLGDIGAAVMLVKVCGLCDATTLVGIADRYDPNILHFFQVI